MNCFAGVSVLGFNWEKRRLRGPKVPFCWMRRFIYAPDLCMEADCTGVICVTGRSARAALL